MSYEQVHALRVAHAGGYFDAMCPVLVNSPANPTRWADYNPEDLCWAVAELLAVAGVDIKAIPDSIRGPGRGAQQFSNWRQAMKVANFGGPALNPGTHVLVDYVDLEAKAIHYKIVK